MSFAKADTLRYEHTPVIVFGIAKIKSIKLTAMLSGLKLEGEICGLQSSLQYKEKIRAPPNERNVKLISFALDGDVCARTISFGGSGTTRTMSGRGLPVQAIPLTSTGDSDNNSNKSNVKFKESSGQSLVSRVASKRDSNLAGGRPHSSHSRGTERHCSSRWPAGRLAK